MIETLVVAPNPSPVSGVLMDTIPLVTPFPGVIPTTPPNCSHFFSGKKSNKTPQNVPCKICEYGLIFQPPKRMGSHQIPSLCEGISGSGWVKWLFLQVFVT